MYGITGYLLSWLKYFVTKRSHCVEVLRGPSARVWMNYGVLEGSVPAPVLFLLYTNNMSYQTSVNQTIQFVEDTTLIFQADCIKNIGIK